MARLTAKKLATEVGMMSEGEVELLHRSAKLVEAENPFFINIGSGVGTSCMALLEARPDAYILSVDVRRRGEVATNLKRAGRLKAHRVFELLGPSQAVGIHWPVPVDLVFVDGAHHPEAVHGDIDAWLPKVKPGGVICFHDYDHPNVPSLTKIVNKRMYGYETIGKDRYLICFRNLKI